MKDVLISISEYDLDFILARDLARIIAEQNEPDTTLVAWYDEKQNTHSPSCVKCEIGDRPGWEVYGENHGGRLKIIINDREYVFMYS